MSLPPRELYESLFCDPDPAPSRRDPGAWMPRTGGWGELRAAVEDFFRNDRARARRRLLPLAGAETADARLALTAWHLLRVLGEPVPPGPPVLGVVIERGGETGADVLAAYRDRTAVLIARDGAVRGWEDPDAEAEDAVSALLRDAEAVAGGTLPDLSPRTGPPHRGLGRLSVLTPAGRHVATGPIQALASDPLTAAMLSRASELAERLARPSR
jgi:hypothetical protein